MLSGPATRRGRPTMSFQDDVRSLLERDIRTMHDGDSGPRKEMWSRIEPVTLEIVAAEADTDLGYTCAIERSSVVQADGSVATYALRVTTIFRREEGDWKIVHRHGSPYMVEGDR